MKYFKMFLKLIRCSENCHVLKFNTILAPFKKICPGDAGYKNIKIITFVSP